MKYKQFLNTDSPQGWVQHLAIAAALTIAGGHSTALADPNQHLEMFLDDARIASTSGVGRDLQEPDRLPNPVITGAGRWDPRRSFGSVIFDESENVYKAWYQLNAGGNPVGYATSVDGLNWNYPSLGLVTYSDSATPPNTNNNLLFRGLGNRSLNNTSVIKDDADPDPSRRYKIAYVDHTDPDTLTNTSGVFLGTSPDGIHWTRSTTPAAPQLYIRTGEQSTHDVIEMMYDGQKQKYVIYSKGYDRTGNRNNNRQIVRTESSDFVNWTTPQVVLRHDHTLLDPQSYGASVFEYEGMYVMLLRMYHNTGLADGERGDRSIDVQLAASRDGINWARVANKETFMHLGAAGTWDDGMILPYRPLEKDGQIQIYYHGWNGVHENPDGTPVSRASSVGLATLSAGRFVAMTANNDGAGSITTKTFVMGGDGLFLNADLGDHGTIRVSLLDGSQNPIPGYTSDLSVLTQYNELYYTAAFGGASLAALEGTSLSLKFFLTGDAKLYGYTTAAAVAAVPEPAAVTLLLVGACGLAARRRYKERSSR